LSLPSRPTPFPTRRSSDLLGVVVATLHRRGRVGAVVAGHVFGPDQGGIGGELAGERPRLLGDQAAEVAGVGQAVAEEDGAAVFADRKSTRLNSSHVKISYA